MSCQLWKQITLLEIKIILITLYLSFPFLGNKKEILDFPKNYLCQFTLHN